MFRTLLQGLFHAEIAWMLWNHAFWCPRSFNQL